jgi:predicted NodU family carbamoyl transferase
MGGPPLILGLSAFFHDSAAALTRGGEIVAAAQEERFSRRKNDERFPREAVAFCLRRAGVSLGDLAAVVFYEKPITKFTRVMETYLAVAPGGWKTFPRVLPSWLAEKMEMRGTLRRELPGLSRECELLFTEHHYAHAASAFFPSPFAEAAVLSVDGVGEWATTAIGQGNGDELTLHQELRFPHSLGLLYSAFTAYGGFRINSGEYKLMGLAPYGEPRYAGTIRSELIELQEDGSFRLNLAYFDFIVCSAARREFRTRPLPPATATWRDPSRWSPRRSCCVWRAGLVRLRGRGGSAWRAGWRSIVWPTGESCGRESATRSGCNRPPGIRVAPWARRLLPGTTVTRPVLEVGAWHGRVAGMA